MKFYKQYIKLGLTLLLFGHFLSCSTQQKAKDKKETTPTEKKNISKEKDTVVLVTKSVYPEYLNKEYVLGRFDYTKHSDFIKIPKEFSSKTRYLRREVFDMFHKMATKAKKEGITLKIVSATRNFAHQKRIWNYKWTDKYKKHPENKRALKILEYSSMPGTSRHHWGTDIDINNLEDAYFLKGQGKKEYDWLINNANKFGFYQAYTSKENGRTGYNEEKWHWSYTPLSSIYLKYYNEHIYNQDIKDFEGSRFAKEINMVKNYVNGVNLKILNYKP